jgi:hypothetical protein
MTRLDCSAGPHPGIKTLPDSALEKTVIDPHDPNHVRAIRAVFLTGLLACPMCGLVYLAVTGHLQESVSLNPLALAGAFIGFAIVGASVGGVCGLSMKVGPASRWTLPVLVSALASMSVGWLMASGLLAMVWGE